MEEFVSLFSMNNVPGLKAFIGVIIGLSVVIGFLVVFLSMYTAVLERTREIGILKALGATPAFVLGVLLRETFVLAVVGSTAGIAVQLRHAVADHHVRARIAGLRDRAGLVADCSRHCSRGCPARRGVPRDARGPAGSDRGALV